MFCRTCGKRLDETDVLCPFCGTPRAVDSHTQAEPLQDDPGFAHFLRMAGVGMSVAMACWIVVGLFWYGHIMSKTGYRKRDLLLLSVPVYGSYLAVVVMWRYTARDVYWTPRDDRPSEVLHGRNRPAAIALGWVLFPIFTAGIIVMAALSAGWSDTERANLVNSFVRVGVDRPVAECMADRIIDHFPAGPGAYADDESIDEAFTTAIDACAPG